jgi:pyruvate dehydrogenase E2 component (dihydrolipoamide acetyltransferase)
MPFEITMPQLGLTMENGSVVEWLIDEGEPIHPGQEILTVETDKAVVPVEAHEAGTLARILVPAGQQVAVGAVLAVATAPGEVLPADWTPGLAAAPAAAGAPRGSEMPVIASEAKKSPIAQAGIASLTLAMTEDSVFQASWKARSLAHAADLDLRTVSGSGPGGRILAGDVAQALARAQLTAEQVPPLAAEIQATPVAESLAAALGLDLSRVRGTGPQGRISQADVLEAAALLIRQAAGQPAPAALPGLPQVVQATPLQGVRKIVSEGMAASVHTSARVTLFRELDAGGLVALRERFTAQGKQVSYNDLLIRICATALREHPEANARLGNGQIEQLDRINIGLAVDTERGLLVPVVRSADRLTIAQIATETARLVAAARAGRCLPDDLSGGTFTLTNLGMFGVEAFTPVINLPECCILGVGSIVRKPAVCDDGQTLAVRPMVTLSLVFDHRVIDGAPAARFLDRIARLAQDPLLLLTQDA